MVPGVKFAGLAFDAHDPEGLAEFWGGLLGWSVDTDVQNKPAVAPGDDLAYGITFHHTDAPKLGQNRIHLDLTTRSEADKTATIARALELGARRIDIGQGAEETHEVLADPEGNELCVIAPGNQFLANTGTVGAINCDGTQELGFFWSAVLGWPLVWDQDEETAIQAPRGGTKITWSGRPLMPRHRRDRLRLCFVVRDLDEAVVALTALGARAPQNPEATMLLDPDGNEFHLMVAEA